MDEEIKIKWKRVVDKFTLQKAWMKPWEALKLATSLPGCSSAERQVILFLLHVWDPGGDWPSLIGPMILCGRERNDSTI